jgi:flagellar hook-length control protein FliK
VDESVVNETNILNLLAKSPAPPEPSLLVSHLEQNDQQRFDRVFEEQVESHEVRDNPEPRESRNPAPVSQNQTAATARTDHQPKDAPPVTPIGERRDPAALNPNKSPSHTDGPSSVSNASATQAPDNPFALPIETLLEDLNPTENAPGLADNPNQAATGVLAGLIDAQGLSEAGSPALDTLRELLAGLNIDAETIDKLVSALQNGNAAGVQGILHALRGLLQASDQVAQAPLAENISDVAAGRLNQPEQRAIDFLVRAGLTLKEAQQVIQQVRTAGIPQPLNENTAQPAKSAAEGIVVKPQTESQPGSGNLQNSGGDSKGSTGHSSEAPRNVSGLTAERLDTLASLVAPDKSSNTGNAQTNPLIAKASASPLQNLNAAGQPVQSILAEGAPGQAPAAGTDAAARAVDFVKPAITETYNGRASMDKPITAQIIEKFTMRGFGHQREVHIKLDPPSLGTVRMNVSTSGDTVRATIIAENNIVKSVIENNLSQLKDSITHQGVKIGSFNVLVGGNASNSAHGHRDALDYLAQLGQGEPLAHESAEENIVLHRPVFMNENQSISIFA